ncbi:MAG: YbhN family protein [Micrococcales bacterium]
MRKHLKTIITWVFYLVIVVFGVNYVLSLDFAKISSISYNWWWLLAASAIGLLTRFYFTKTWMWMLQTLGGDAEHHHVQLFSVYARAWLGRYIPGGAAWIVGKIYFASQLGISKIKLGVSSLLEGGLQVIIQLVLACALLAFDPRIEQVYPGGTFWLLAIAVIGLISVWPNVFNPILKFAYRRVKKENIDPSHLPSKKLILGGLLWFLLTASTSAISYFFVALSVDQQVGIEDLLFIMGTSSLAGGISMLVIFAPGGLGVREAVVIASASLIMSPEHALVFAAVSRLWTVVIDVIYWAAVQGWASSASRRSKEKLIDLDQA